MLDYYAIGQRIRLARKTKFLSQEKLAEKISISPTHMSHIETGDTKLSLQVIADISDVLNISIDELIHGNTVQTNDNNIQSLLNSFSADALRSISLLADNIKLLVDKKI